MTTERQRAANRRNGRQGRGPTSAAGKAMASQNARTHGLCARTTVVLPDEDAVAFDTLEENLRATLQPVGAAEELLVDRVVAAQWRLQRVQRIEVGLFEYHCCRAAFADAQRTVERVVNDESERVARIRRTLGHLPNIPRWRRVKDQEAVADALIAAAALEERRERSAADVSRAFVADLAAFGLLSRYEAPLRRELYSALHELERQQRRRAGETIAAPQAVDVQVDVQGALPGDHRGDVAGPDAGRTSTNGVPEGAREGEE